MAVKITRREMIHGSVSAAGIGMVWSETSRGNSRSPNEKLNIAAIGVGGRGISNITAVSDENIVALCDVDEKILEPIAERYPSASTCHDFREMLLARNDLDAVVISTPDHTHFHTAMMAMNRGLHVYVEKPLAHSIYECRELVKKAREKNVVTQMGNQHHSADGYRRVFELVQSGTIGDVREVHSWTSRPNWPQGIERPAETPKIPKHLHWDVWLGPAPERPYHPAYHPRSWRGWWDFGVGALGDMGPHLIDPAYWALRLSLPKTISADSPEVNRETAPNWSVVQFEFPARDESEKTFPPVKLTWYDGGKQPPPEVTGVRQPPPNGTLLLGTRAKLFAPQLGRRPIVIPNDKDDRIKLPEPFWPKSLGHHAEWIAACKGEGKTSSPFEYGAALTETCLLGNLALRTGKQIDWDAPKMAAKDCPNAKSYIRREYRDGWTDL